MADFCAFPKPEREENPEYRVWIASKPCLVGIGCNGDVVAHHLRHGVVGGKGPDRFCVPLCGAHHNEVHNKGQETTGFKYAIDWYFYVCEFREEWWAEGLKTE